MTKLTLELDDGDARLAEEMASAEGVSVSALIVKLLRRSASRRQRKAEREKLPPLTRKAFGMIKLPKGKTERELVEEALAKKYGLDR